MSGISIPTYALAKSKAKAYTDSAIAAIGTNMTYKGSVASKSALPLTGNKKGDVYNTTDDGSEYVWTIDSATGTLDNWNQLGGSSYTVTIDV